MSSETGAPYREDVLGQSGATQLVLAKVRDTSVFPSPCYGLEVASSGPLRHYKGEGSPLKCKTARQLFLVDSEKGSSLLHAAIGSNVCRCLEVGFLQPVK